jgi:phosphoribosyl-ATP pyrophosphohydrolase/phosphoribosyl-AMP cyclohydrolase
VIVPSIDLLDGKVVQLQQGARKMLEREDALALAERFARVGTVAVVDLNAALGRGDNRKLVRSLCRAVPCRVGGGLRDAEAALAALRSGAEEVVIGTAASEELLRALPRERAFVALDARAGKIATEGWTQAVGETPLERARRPAGYCGGFLYTSVEREGMLGGPDLQTARQLRAATDRRLILAGGITTIEEIVELDREGIDAQVGMALYTGALDEVDAFIAAIDFERMNGLVPTIVCDAGDGRPRMLAYSTKESLALALRAGAGIYWSRSRQAMWCKGETSGHAQRLRRVEVDCDRDALTFTVVQTGPTCHTGRDRCFGDAPFEWPALVERIDARLSERSASSYTVKLSADAVLLDGKIIEEAQEVVEAQSDEELAWECAEMLYFRSVKLRSRGLATRDVFAQLASRAR